LLEEAGLVRLRSNEGLQAAEGIESGGKPASRQEPEGGDSDRGRYDWFRDRIMFPIRSVQGEVIGFGGRVFDDSKPKYINSPETPVFSKGRELYGLFEARQALREKGYALVVEGYMDVVALAQWGLPNAVATLGTACTADHVQKLFRFTDSVVFSFDGDAAGRRAAARALEASLPHATDLRTVRFLFLPTEHDPDSYVRELGQAAFETQVAQAVPLSRQMLELARDGADLSAAEGRARFLAQAKPMWVQLPDGVLKQQVLGELAREAQMNSDELQRTWGGQPAATGGARSNAPIMGRPARTSRPTGRRPPAGLADLALRLLLRHAEWWDRLSADDHGLLHGLGGNHGDAVAWLEQQITEHGPLTWAALDELLDGQELRAEARRWAEHGSIDESQRFEDLERVLHLLWIEQHREETRVLIDEGRTDREQLDLIAELNSRIKAHRTAERALAKPE
jgi:DNA primase